jgi:coenzyme F420-dependent glucose-6-phosphate dehydrogenase
MTDIGYQASHEQFSPRDLLHYTNLAAQAGFAAVLSSDHLAPWSTTQGHSGFAWSWLGAAMQSTALQFGVVTVPGYRYHPVVLAQAVATLDQLFPGRFFLTMGSGEALNEASVIERWPAKAQRNAVLQESAAMMRKLWRGETVSSQGAVTANAARIYDLPSEPPTIIGAALSPETAQWLGTWADGMITTARPLPELTKMIDAFYQGGGAGQPVLLKAQLSYGKTREEALEGAYQEWRFALVAGDQLGELRKPEDFESAAQQVTRAMVREQVEVITTPEEAIAWLKGLQQLPLSKIILHNVNRDQERFITDFGKDVLPYV